MASASESPSLSPSASESPSPSPSESPSNSPSLSPSASESPSNSPSLSPSASESPSNSPSESPSESPSNSPSESPSDSPSLSPSASESPSESPSASPSLSPSVSIGRNSKTITLTEIAGDIDLGTIRVGAVIFQPGAANDKLILKDTDASGEVVLPMISLTGDYKAFYPPYPHAKKHFYLDYSAGVFSSGATVVFWLV